MVDFPIVDSHVHLLEPQEVGYGWTSGAPQLNRRVVPADFFAAAAPVAIEQFVFVEVDADPGLHLAEADWVAGLAATEPRLTGMVASLPLEKGLAVEPDLDALQKHAIFKAVRRLIQTQPDPDFCIRPDFIAGLKLLGRRDVAFDICIFHHHLPNVIRMVGECPDVRFVLDHIAKPGIRDGLVEPWTAHLRTLASHGNVVCKISGVATEADHRNWTREQLKPYVAHAIDCFGFDRVLFGGDWHVAELAIGYAEWVGLVEEVIAGASEQEKRKLFRDNAIRTYRLPDRVA